MRNAFMKYQSSPRNPLSLALSAALIGLAAGNAQAFEFNIGDDFNANVSTTLSYGVSYRTSERDPNLVGKCNFIACQGLTATGAPIVPLAALPNSVQRAAVGRYSVNNDDGNLNYDRGDVFSNTAKITAELGWTYGENFGGLIRATAFYDFENQKRDDLSALAKEKVGKDAQLLDAFAYYNFAEGAGSVRLGRQVVSWGESTFIQQGINVVNPIDVSKLRIAGAELKEAFLPIDMLWASYSFNENLSIEALYMFEFEQTEPEPAGTYFSTNDFGSLGGQFVVLNFGLVGQPENYADCFRPGVINPRNVGAVSACSASVLRTEDQFASDNGQYGLAARYFSPELNNTEFGFYFLNYHSRLPLFSGNTVRNSNANSATVFIEYPEDVRLFGLSFNTTLDESGIALQGELSYRPNTPLQIDDVELLFYGLSPLNALLPADFNRFSSQLGQGRPNEYIRGWERHKVSQYQMTATKVFGPENPIGADQVSAVAEIGFTKVWDLPSTDVLRYQGDGTDTGGGDDFLTGRSRNPQTQVGGFPTRFSWGYRIAARADYNNFLSSPFTMSPRVAFNHDVNGITPGPGGNFLEGRKSITVGVEANYLNQWTLDLSYTDFFGAEPYNLVADRDFISMAARYAF
jgi:hypothetical protein